MAKIETGVDRLVEIISQTKRVSVDEAAQKLGVSKIVVQEWADFLEEEKIISIEYKFSKTFLVERRLTGQEIKQKEKEYTTEKDAFVRKVEGSIRNLENDSLGLEKIKTEFETLKKNLGGEVETVRNEVKKLEKYETLKRNLDIEIQKQVAEFNAILEKSHLALDAEEKKHQQIVESLEIEKRELQVKEKRLQSFEEKEKEIIQRIQSLYSISKELQKRVEEEKSSISSGINKVVELEKSVKEVEKAIVGKREQIQPLIDKARKHEENILKLQQEILIKAKRKSEEIKNQVQEGSKVLQNFQAFFNRKDQIEQLIVLIEKERLELENDFKVLQQKALSFDIASKTSTVGTQMKDLEVHYQNSNTKREELKENLEKLIKLIKG